MVSSSDKLRKFGIDDDTLDEKFEGLALEGSMGPEELRGIVISRASPKRFDLDKYKENVLLSNNECNISKFKKRKYEDSDQKDAKRDETKCLEDDGELPQVSNLVQFNDCLNKNYKHDKKCQLIGYNYILIILKQL